MWPLQRIQQFTSALWTQHLRFDVLLLFCGFEGGLKTIRSAVLGLGGGERQRVSQLEFCAKGLIILKSGSRKGHLVRTCTWKNASRNRLAASKLVIWKSKIQAHFLKTKKLPRVFLCCQVFPPNLNIRQEETERMWRFTGGMEIYQTSFAMQAFMSKFTIPATFFACLIKVRITLRL